MKVEVHFHSFTTSGERSAREKAAKWMEEQYEKYDNRIISSNFAEDDTSATAYITVLSEPQEPTVGKTPVILK
jgi:hypothetical protein